jgi:hypothetical protein
MSVWSTVQRAVLTLASVIFALAGVFLVVAQRSAMAWFCALFFGATSLVLVVDFFPNNPLARRRQARMQARYSSVSCDERAVVVDDRKGNVSTLPWCALERVFILTTDEGPYVCDFYWVLETDVEACSFASESEGAAAVVKALMALPGFDCAAAVLAAGSVTPNLFPVWKRP